MERARTLAAAVDTSMQTFMPWPSIHVHRMALLRRLLEAADTFDPSVYNQVFDSELETLRQQMPDAEVAAKLENLKGMDWGGYIAREVRKAGFRGSDVDEYVHHIVVKLLVSPGKLFTGWNPQQHGPLDRRFGASVRNEIRNIIDKQSNRRKYVPTVSIRNDFTGVGVAEKYLPPAQAQDDTLIADFRDWLQRDLGDLAVAVFDARLAGADARSLVGADHLGRPSNNKVRTTMQAIKQSAMQFADGDAVLRDRIEELLQRDRQTAERMRTAGQQKQNAEA